MKKLLSLKTLVAIAPFIFCSTTYAWDYEGHRWVNQIALASLPTNFPAFVRDAKAQERIAFLAGEPDRWRNQTSSQNPTGELPLKHFNAPDHYIDIDDLPGWKPQELSHFRYQFTAQLALERKEHPEKISQHGRWKK